MLALLEIARIYKDLKHFADLQGSICGVRTTDCGLGIKYGLGIICGLRTEYKTRTRY